MEPEMMLAVQLRRLLAALSLLAPPAAAGAQQVTADSLHWLSGCWQLAGARSVVDEQWMAPRGGEMLGMSRTVSGGATREYEFLRIYARGDTLIYAARPAGQPAAEFRATKISATEVIFENPQHDFPQKIGYRLQSPDSLVAWIEGGAAERLRVVTYPYRRTECAPRAPAAGRP